jgi:DNA polymerase III alpha subunit (gram-positive type)
VVLTGHDVGQDIRYLQKIGYNVENMSNLHKPNVDTQNLYRALQRKKLQNSNTTQINNAVGLSSILEEYDIPPFGLHNAGNDATYTLQAMLAMVIGDSAGREAAMTANVQDWTGNVSASQKSEAIEKDPLDDLPKWAKADEDYDPWD